MTKVARLKMQEDAKPTGREVAIRFMPKEDFSLGRIEDRGCRLRVVVHRRRRYTAGIEHARLSDCIACRRIGSVALATIRRCSCQL